MSEINHVVENLSYHKGECNCECGALSGSIHDGLECNMCDTVCSGDNMPARVMSNTRYSPSSDTKESTPVVNVTIEQQKTSTSTAIAFVLGSMVVCGGILAAAWFLKR